MIALPIRLKKNGRTYYKDILGTLSPFYYQGTEYCEGFAIVKVSRESSPMYRDMLGNLSQNPSKLGRDFYYYYIGEKSVDELDDEYFLLDNFYDAVYKLEKFKLIYESKKIFNIKSTTFPPLATRYVRQGLMKLWHKKTAAIRKNDEQLEQ